MKFGLGAVIVADEKKAKLADWIEKVEAGMVFVNEVVKSDMSLPSGGIKQSGFGRECAKYGIESFANVKTVWIN
jgi:succinate-semialdehyde dehydrogenase/glutarate-semialdehyde dehydrogenase